MSKQFTLTIECDNAAFEDDLEYEVSRILAHVGRQVEDGYNQIYLLDSNGNRCGFAQFTGE